MLYALGSNGCGQLGLGHTVDVSAPTPCTQDIQNLARVTKPFCISAGGNHTLILYTSGEVYSIGAGTQSKPSDAEKTSPETAGRLLCSNASFCAATWEASTVCYNDASKLSVWGRGTKGELGCGADVTDIPEGFHKSLQIPGLGENGLHVADLASGMQHTVVVLSDGSVYGWGNVRKGQLGRSAGVVWSPTRIEGLSFKVIKAVCGREFTYLVGEPGAGQHAVLGSDKWQVINGAPERVPNWKQIGAGWGSIHVLFEDGSIKSWGRNDHGQLPPQGLPPIYIMANGSEHSIAVTSDGKVLAWGWGEHGNCGSEIDKEGDVKGRWNRLQLPETGSRKVVGCGAGCATSWCWT